MKYGPSIVGPMLTMKYQYHLPLASRPPTLKGRTKLEIDIGFDARRLVVGVADDLDALKVVHDD